MKLFNRNTGVILLIILLVEAISFTGFLYPSFKLFGLLIVAIVALILSLRNLEYGLLLLVAELIIGSKGHLLDFSAISVRMIIFGAIMLAFLIRLFTKIEREKLSKYIKELKSLKYLLALAFFIIFGLIIAFLKNNDLGNILADFNSWLFFLLFFPSLLVYFKADNDKYRRLITVSTAALLWLNMETLLILYIYSHNLSIMPSIYLWLRKTGVAEITNTLNGFPRIFLQSQIYVAVAIIATSFATKKKAWSFWAIAILSWGTLFLSMSRSFWLASAVCLLIGVLIYWKNILNNILFISGTAIAGGLLIFLITVFPIPKPGLFSLDSFLNRTNLDKNEAALASRWALLPALFKEIKKSPIIGQGYGSTIDYKSSDPRVLEQNPDGIYSTYSFEWGYLSIWLKLGFLGLVSYLLLIGQNIYLGFKKRSFLALVLMLLAIIQVFTPYLDHPLGIALIITAIIGLESCVKCENKVY